MMTIPRVITLLFVIHLISVAARVPFAEKVGGSYLRLFEIDYGCEDTVRPAGRMQGFLPHDGLNLGEDTIESDDTEARNINEEFDENAFLRWWNRNIEYGSRGTLAPSPVKLYSALDIGQRSDLKPNENPKIILIEKNMSVSSAPSRGRKIPLSSQVETKVIELKSPWLRRRADFAYRFVVTNPIQYLNYLQAKGQVKSEVSLRKDKNGKPEYWATLTFKPTWFQRVFGGKREERVERLLTKELLQPKKLPKKPQQDEKPKSKNSQD